MKKLSIISVFVCCLAALCLTSCNNDDSPRGLPPEEVKTAFLTVKGSYDGDLIYEKKVEGTAKPGKPTLDTLKISWQIDTDSTMLIKSFPSKLLATYITDKNLSATLAEQPNSDIKCYIGFYSMSPVAFIINPVALAFNVNYGGKDHKVQVAFNVNSAYSFGAYNSTKKLLQMQIVEAAIYIDGKYEKAMLDTAVPFVLSAKR